MDKVQSIFFGGGLFFVLFGQRYTYLIDAGERCNHVTITEYRPWIPIAHIN